MPGAIVLAPYRVKLENQEEFLNILKNKRSYFLSAGYATKRPALLLQSKKNKEILIDIFEWTSEKHCDDAHNDKNVREYWNKMEELWEEGGFPLNKIIESTESFTHFDPVDIY